MTAKREWTMTLVIICLVLLLPDLANAQAIGGGGGNFLSGALQWIQGNLITSLSTLAVILLGILLMSLRFSPIVAISICAGIWIVFNATYLSGLLRA